MLPTATDEQLQRAIGPLALALAVVNSVVGSGIFVLPALVAAELGAASILAYVVCGALVFMIGLCFAELGSGTTVSGGLYTYIERAFGPYAGFLATNVYWLGCAVTADAAIANALSDALAGFFPVLSTGLYRAVFIVLVFAALALINIRSVRSGVRFIELTSLGKLIPLVILVVVAAGFVDPANLHWAVEPDAHNVGAASLLLFFAFQGLETPLMNGGEIKDPRRTVPRGLLLGLGLVLLLYMAIHVVVVGVLGTGLQAHQSAPVVAVAGVVFGVLGAFVIGVVSMVSITGSLAGNVLSVPRILYASSRNGWMPKPLARVHPEFLTPHIAIAVYTLFGCVLALSGEFRQLAILSSAAGLLIYLGCALAAMKLRRSKTSGHQESFRAPGGILVPVLAICGIVWLLSNLEPKELTAVGLLLLILSAIYGMIVLAKRRNTSKVHSKNIRS